LHDAVELGGEVEARVLGQRQGVHVAPQQHGGTGSLAVEVGDDRALALAGRDREREPVQRLEHPSLRVWQVEPELGPAVQVAPQGDDVIEQRPGLGQERVGGRLGGDGGGGHPGIVAHITSRRVMRCRPPPILGRAPAGSGVCGCHLPTRMHARVENRALSGWGR
jgi:hypothetical protein